MHKFIKAYFGQFTLHGGGGKGGGAAPPPPDYRGAAVEQSAASKELATGATWANRPTINTPWGRQTWGASAGTDPSTGLPVTKWESNIDLTPEQQAALDAQQRIGAGKSSAAEGLLGQATEGFKKPVDWAGMPAAPKGIEEAQQGAFGKMSAMLQPGRQQQSEALETRLANMGLPQGSEAYKRAKAQLGDQFAQQDKGLLAQSLAEGRADVGSQTALRQQAIAEEAQRRGMSLNELNALLGGTQVSMPSMPGQPNSTAQAGQAPNFLGAAQSQGQYGLGAAGMNQGGGMDVGSAVGGIASVAAIAM
jgi:hypothetical protein